MAATKSDLRQWFERGVSQGATHMVVVCDTFDYEDYPVYVSPEENVGDVVYRRDGRDMQKVMEVYRLDMSKEAQLQSDERVWNY